MYAYTARDARGTAVSGQLEAASADDAGSKLRQDGFQSVQILNDEGSAPLFPRRVSKREIIYLTSQLAIMVETGIKLSAALGGIVQQEENPTLRRMLLDLKSSVESGEDFSAALARYPKLFDKTYVSLVKASEATGMLGEMLESHRQLLAQGGRNAQQGPRGDGLSGGDDGRGHCRDDFPADLRAAEVHAAVQQPRHEAARADRSS